MAAQVVTFEQHVLRNCCGVEEVGDFSSWLLPDGADTYSNEVVKPGTGYFISTFTGWSGQREAYEHLCREHKLLWQSRPRHNGPRGNQVFIAVFLHKDAK